MRETRRWAGTVLPLALAFLVLLGSVAYASVWTDEEDYVPGSVVTISGDNGNGAGYLAGETVAVEVFGPNGFAATCDGVADAAGGWTCQITLWADERAVGDYTYTATGQTSGVSEDGVFTDNDGTHNVRFSAVGLPAGLSFSISGQRHNPGNHNLAPFGPTLFTTPNPSGNVGARPSSSFTYSGFPLSLAAGGQNCTLTSTSPASPFITGAASGLTTVIGTYSCVSANTAPTTPGVPILASGSNPNNTGVFDLGWTASTDAENDPITYVLQHKDADDGSFSNVASGIATNGYSFTGPGEAEGTWTYRAQASDGSLSSAFSGPSSAIVVDKSAPNAPSLAADRAPEYAGGGGWYRDTVTVSTSGNGDPNLQDGSAGSGVAPASVAGDATFSTSGSHAVTETVFDNAGNESATASSTFQVDATDPVVNITCPAANVFKDSAASANWTAGDAHSGLASAASGSVNLTTSAVGPHTAYAPTATDNVGHTKGASCTYNVVYNWTGFFQPVENPGPGPMYTFNRVKAGSAIPTKFSLNGDQGLAIMASGYPKSERVSCSSAGYVDNIEETVTAGGSSLSYDPVKEQYNYVWKTDRGWAGTCRKLTVQLVDGTQHIAYFHFTK